MKTEIRLYTGVAKAEAGNRQNFPIGERHAINLFLSQEDGSAPAWDIAESILADAHWSNLEQLKTAIAQEEKTLQSGPPFPDMYRAAIANGSALLVYSTPE